MQHTHTHMYFFSKKKTNDEKEQYQLLREKIISVVSDGNCESLIETLKGCQKKYFTVLLDDALECASKIGRENIIKLLLKCRLSSSSFYFPIRYAIEKGHENIVKLLLYDNRLSSDTLNEIMYFAYENKHDNMIELLSAGLLKKHVYNRHMYIYACTSKSVLKQFEIN